MSENIKRAIELTKAKISSVKPEKTEQKKRTAKMPNYVARREYGDETNESNPKDYATSY